MSEMLTAEGYEQTKEKLRDLGTGLAAIEQRTDLDAEHLASVRRSCKMMMREFFQDLKLYEAKQVKPRPSLQPTGAVTPVPADSNTPEDGPGGGRRKKEQPSFPG